MEYFPALTVRSLPFVLLPVLVLLASSCGTGSSTPNPSAVPEDDDAGISAANQPPDSGELSPDASVAVDAGSSDDAGSPFDAGTGFDAGQPVVLPRAPYCRDGGTLPTFSCPGFVARASAEELCASPRSDIDAEFLALELSGAFLAPEELYQQISNDLVRLRAAIPEVQGIRPIPKYLPSIIIDFEPDAGVVPAAYHAWDCLNAYYGSRTRHVGNPPFAWASFDFAPILDAKQLADDYRTLPDVRYSEANSLGGDGSDICVMNEGSDRAYIFDRGGGDCPAGCTEHQYYGGRALSDGGIELLGAWNRWDGGTRPEWLTSRTQCTQNL